MVYGSCLRHVGRARGQQNVHIGQTIVYSLQEEIFNIPGIDLFFDPHISEYLRLDLRLDCDTKIN